MEVTNVEAWAERLPGTVTELEDLELSNHVTGGLPRPVEVALHLLGRIALGQQGVLQEVLDRLLARPLFRMNTGIGDQANSTP